MFSIPARKRIDTDLPIIVDNFRPFLMDESPVLFSGTNRFGNTILGSSVDEDYTKGIERYFHAIVEIEEYFCFLKRKVTYLDLLKRARPLFVIDKAVNDNRYTVYELSLDDIPAAYTPAEDTYCPEAIYTPSFQYTASLQGRLADSHRAVPQEVSQTQNSIAEAIKNAFSTVRNVLKVEEHVFLEASYAPGSFEINYDVQLENVPSLFQQEREYYLYLNEFLEYCFENLPTEAEQIASLRFDELESFNRLAQRFRELSIGKLEVSDFDLRESLARDLAKSAQALHAASKDVGRNYRSIAVRNGVRGQERPLGLITPEYRKQMQIVTEKLEDSPLLAHPVSETSKPEKYAIHVFQFHKENGTGFAYLRSLQDETKQETVRLAVDPYEPVSPNPYTHSLDQNTFIKVIGTKSGKFLNVSKHLED